MRYVYFARRANGSGPIKIGCSSWPTARLKQLSINLKEKVVPSAIAAGGFADEHSLHRRFASHRAGGEWFEPADEILQAIEFINVHGVLPSPWPSDRNALAVEKYRAGASLRKVGKDLGISHEMVRIILRAEHVPLRSSSGRP